MNLSETQLNVARASSSLAISVDSNRIRTITGSYYRVIGWVDLVSSVISLALVYWTGHVAITFGFILWFWIGNCLKQGNSTARNWAIISSFLSVTLLGVGMCFPHLGFKLAPWGIGYTSPIFLLLAGVMMMVLAFPAVLLLSKRGRRAFPKQDGESGPRE